MDFIRICECLKIFPRNNSANGMEKLRQRTAGQVYSHVVASQPHM